MGEEQKTEAENLQQKAEAEFKKMIETPISREDLDKALADNDIQIAQLRVIRLRKIDELNQIDHQIEMANLDRSVVVRRSLNKASAEPEMRVVGGEDK